MQRTITRAVLQVCGGTLIVGVMLGVSGVFFGGGSLPFPSAYAQDAVVGSRFTSGDALALAVGLLGVVFSVLMVVVGFLLNRIFSEIDRLRGSDEELIRTIAALQPMLIGKKEFLDHLNAEEQRTKDLLGTLEELRSMTHSIQLRLAAAGLLKNSRLGDLDGSRG